MGRVKKEEQLPKKLKYSSVFDNEMVEKLDVKVTKHGNITPSFSLYIFGYDEIDITMEVEETPEAREATIAWETRQLGIMDWITNDVDWMTKEVHPSSVRLAWHN